MSSQTLSSKPKEEPAVVALQVVVSMNQPLNCFVYRGYGAPIWQCLDNILQNIKVIWKEVAQIHGENTMIETLGGDV